MICSRCDGEGNVITYFPLLILVEGKERIVQWEEIPNGVKFKVLKCNYNGHLCKFCQE